ncbi:MAG: spore germination protein [Clostridia bacterium]|nr:spore germination protein [Clostridia bacterium]
MNISKLYKYQPQNNYEFTIEPEPIPVNTKDTKVDQDKNLYPNITQNLEHIQTVYNTLINSDIVVRQFSLTSKNKLYKAFIVFIDGMVDSDLINNYILKPLMLRNRNNTFDGTLNNNSNIETAHKIKSTDLIEYVYTHLIPQNNVEKRTKFSEIISGINSGNCALFVDTISTAFDIEVKGFKQRSIDTPQNEVIIKGPQEAYVENIRTNTSLLRRIVNNENLIIENIEIGEISKTKCALCYMNNIANPNLVAEAKYRLNNLSIDTLLSSGQLEQLIEDNNIHGIPQILSTERPDKTVKALMQGRIAIIVNGTPYAMIIPAVLIDFLASPEDSNLKPLFANFLKWIRLLATLITLLLPGLYIAITSYHQELLPTELLFSILAARESVPFPIIVELLIMEISFELIREGGLRVPSAIGPTLGIVGALILGDAAVSANIVSPILIIIVAITGLSSFVIPDFSFGFHLRIYRFAFTISGYICGFLGIALGLFIYISLMASIQSFGVPFTAPLIGRDPNYGHKYIVSPFWKQEYRESYIDPKKKKSQDKISMKWRE